MRGKKVLLAVAVGFSTFALATQALAIMSVPCGWYLEGNVGSAHISGISFPGNSSSSGIGVNIDLGYKFMPYFAIEVGGSEFPETTIKNELGDKVAKIKHFSYDIAAKGIVPIIDSGFELFAKAGAVRNLSQTTIENTPEANALGIGKGNHSATGLYLGIGGQYYFMPELAVVVQWQRAKGNSSTGTLDLYSVGLSFIFY